MVLEQRTGPDSFASQPPIRGWIFAEVQKRGWDFSASLSAQREDVWGHQQFYLSASGEI